MNVEEDDYKLLRGFADRQTDRRTNEQMDDLTHRHNYLRDNLTMDYSSKIVLNLSKMNFKDNKVFFPLDSFHILYHCAMGQNAS